MRRGKRARGTKDAAPLVTKPAKARERQTLLMTLFLNLAAQRTKGVLSGTRRRRKGVKRPTRTQNKGATVSHARRPRQTKCTRDCGGDDRTRSHRTEQTKRPFQNKRRRRRRTKRRGERWPHLARGGQGGAAPRLGRESARQPVERMLSSSLLQYS